jgi:hypothetical protein
MKAQAIAASARTPELREAWLDIAKGWSKLADELDQISN